MSNTIIESVKMFTDILFEYPKLKFIFDYGFILDKRITQLLYLKNEHSIRELMNILLESIQESEVTTTWRDSVPLGKSSKSKRLLILKNHYRLNQNRWFLEIYKCYGFYESSIIHQITQYRKKYDCTDKELMFCNRNNGSCPYQKYCAIEFKNNSFLMLTKNPSYVLDYKLNFELEYADILNDRKLKTNCWTWEHLKESSILKEQEDYFNFLEMIRFFSMFTPLSVLGYNFLRRLNVEATSSFWFIRNLPIDFGFEQEYIHRVLSAIVTKHCIWFENPKDTFIPIQLFYKDRGFEGLPEHLYLKAISTKTKKLKILPLHSGQYIGVSNTQKKEFDFNNVTPKNPKEKVFDFEVDFYFNNESTYLKRRRRNSWEQCIISTLPLDNIHHMISPYHPHSQDWNIERVTYRIKSSDLSGFLLYIYSFGDFATIVKSPDKYDIPDSPKLNNKIEKGHNQEEWSLLNVYNSETLLQNFTNQSMLTPPRAVELEWLDFILNHYPNMAQIFLTKDQLTALKSKLEVERSPSMKQWFNNKHFLYENRVLDIQSPTIAKYQNIFHAVKNKKLLEYEFHGKTIRIFPYALEYNVINHLSTNNREPLDIMCYDLNEKRNIRIKYKTIQTKNQFSFNDINFSEFDKLYHALAYGIRCAIQNEDAVIDFANNLFELLWTKRGSNTNYERCIKKRFNKEYNYINLYNNLQNVIETHCPDEQKTQIKLFVKNVFDFWKKEFSNYPISTEKSSLQFKYQVFVLKCFTESCKRLWSRKSSSTIRTNLDKITSAHILELISGKEQNGVINEIAFANEKLNNDKVSFLLKKGTPDSIDLVYNLFRDYICAGELLDSGQIRFTITYEKFYYRKIHMLLLSIRNLIKEIQPDSVGEIIKQRISNIEDKGALQ
jgi:hypothetical protein